MVLAFCAANAGSVEAQMRIAKLVSSDAEEGDTFGESIAYSGGTVIIGAPIDHVSTDHTGAAYVYEIHGQAWTQVQKLKGSDATFGAEFGRCVAIEGDIAVVGAFHDDALGLLASGSAFVFERIAGTWVETAKLVASDAMTDESFGTAVAVLSDRIIVGAQYDSHLDQYVGSGYVFEKTGSTWSQAAKLLADDWSLNSYFGNAVALSGEWALIGATTNNISTPYSSEGAAYVFHHDASGWVQTQKLAPNDAAPNDLFGWAVALDGDRAVIGASNKTTSSPSAGAAYIFEESGGIWTQQQRLTASDGGQFDSFGISVALSGDDVVVGALGDDDLGPDTGAAYAFHRAGSAWVQTGKLLAPDRSDGDFFGFASALQGDVALVSAMHDDDACPDSDSCNSGSVSIFRLAQDAQQYCSCPPGSGVCVNPDPHGGCRNQTGHGAVLAASGTGSVLADDLILEVTDLPPNKAGLLFMGGAQASVLFANGRRCVGGGPGGVHRFPLRNGGAQAMIVEGPGLAAFSQSHFSIPGHIAAGQTWYFQCWYRDPQGPCGFTSNYSNALRATFSP